MGDGEGHAALGRYRATLRAATYAPPPPSFPSHRASPVALLTLCFLGLTLSPPSPLPSRLCRMVVRQAEDNEGGRGSSESPRMARNGVLIAQARAMLIEAEAAWQALPPEPPSS